MKQEPIISFTMLFIKHIHFGLSQSTLIEIKSGAHLKKRDKHFLNRILYRWKMANNKGRSKLKLNEQL